MQGELGLPQGSILWPQALYQIGLTLVCYLLCFFAKSIIANNIDISISFWNVHVMYRWTYNKCHLPSFIEIFNTDISFEVYTSQLWVISKQ